MFADQYGVTVLSAAPNPWVITLDDFVSDEEINSLMKGVKPEFDTKKPPSTRADKSSNSTTNTSIGNNSSMLNASKLWTEVTTTLGGFIAKGEHKDNNSTYVWCLGECERVRLCTYQLSTQQYNYLTCLLCCLEAESTGHSR